MPMAKFATYVSLRVDHLDNSFRSKKNEISATISENKLGRSENLSMNNFSGI